MLQNFGQCYGMACTLINVSFGSTFTIIPPIKGQLGVALWTGSTGLEIAGGGASYGPTSITLINGVTSTLTFMNSNGSSLNLSPNGSGLPIFNTILAPISFAGAPNLWLTSGTTNLSVRVAWLLSDAFINQ